MGKFFSCLINRIYIGDYPPEAPLPARPVSQQQLRERQHQLLRQRQSTRARSQRLANQNVGEYGGQEAQGGGQGLEREGEGMELAEDEEDRYEPRDSEAVSHRHRRRRRGVEYERDEDEEENGYEYEDDFSYQPPQRSRPPPSTSQTEHSRNRAEETIFQRCQSSHSQLPRRLETLPSQYAHEYDPEILRHERRARRSARDGVWRARQNRSDDAPPRYEDHVFDRVVDDGDR